MKYKKNKRKNFCDISYFMKYGCRGCKRSQECEQFYTNLERRENIDKEKEKGKEPSRKT